MKDKQDEKLFDDAIRTKLASAAEEVPDKIWYNINLKKDRRGLFAWLNSMTGFLLQDLFLLVALFSLTYIYGDGASIKQEITFNPGASESPGLYNKQKDLNTQNEQNAHINTSGTNSKANDDASLESLPSSDENINRNSDIYNYADDKEKVNDKSASVNSGSDEGTVDLYSKSRGKKSGAAKPVKDVAGKPVAFKSVFHADDMMGKGNTKGYSNVYFDESLSAVEAKKSDKVASVQKIINAEVVLNDDISVERINTIQLMEIGKTEKLIKYPDVFADAEVKGEKQFRSMLGLRIDGGAVYSFGKIKNSSDYVVTDKNPNAFNGKSFQALFEFPLSKKWNLVAGVGHMQTNYQWQLSYTSVLSGYTVDSINGFIVFPFDPPIPYGYVDSNYFVNTYHYLIDNDLTIQAYSIYIMTEHFIHGGKLDVRLDAGLKFNSYNRKVVVKGELDNTLDNVIESGWKSNTGFDGVFAMELNRAGNGYLQPFIRTEAATSFSDWYTKKSELSFKENNCSFLVGVRFRFIK